MQSNLRGNGANSRGKEDVLKWTNEWFDKQSTAQSSSQR